MLARAEHGGDNDTLWRFKMIAAAPVAAVVLAAHVQSTMSLRWD